MTSVPLRSDSRMYSRPYGQCENSIAVPSMAVSSYQSAQGLQRKLSLSRKGLKEIPDALAEMLRREGITHLDVSNNDLSPLPPHLFSFDMLLSLDISNNSIGELPPELCTLRQLKTLVAKHNQMKSLPKDFGQLRNLLELNLSGNKFEQFPLQICDLDTLSVLHLGGNTLKAVPPDIARLGSLTYLYLGGNRLQEVPPELGHLSQLSALVLCGNQLQSLPNSLTHLFNLHSLHLHDNQLQTLPKGLLKLTTLRELSLRNNPLVLRFVREWPSAVPTLLELSGRCIKKNSIPYSSVTIPCVLVDYLDSAQHCDNPKCNGVYFATKVQEVKFVDFCGKYRIPFKQYLCSAMCASEEVASCISSSDSEETDEIAQSKIRKVLLG